MSYSFKKKKWYEPQNLKGKVLLTIIALLIIRIGCQVPVPLINQDYLDALFANNSAFSFVNMFSGGALSQFAFFALGISPYITASIVLQLLAITFPSLEEIQKDGAHGKKQWDKITFITGIGLAFFQGIFIAISFGKQGLLTKYTWWAVLLVTCIWTLGTAIVSFIGQFVTKNGIGNGTSLIIAINIIAGFPSTAVVIYEMYLKNKPIGNIILNSFIILLISVVFIILVVVLDNAHKKIPVQYAKASQYGRSINSDIPIKLNTAGVMPIILASTIYSLPLMFFSNSKNNVLVEISKYFSSHYWFDLDHLYYTIGLIVYGVLVVAFAYFYTQITFNPAQIATNLKKSGASIPGIRPGKPTQEYLERQMKYMTLIGALFLFVIAEIPTVISHVFNISSLSFGGTSIIIVVGVIVETTKKIRSEMMSKSYAKESKSFLFGIPTKS